MKKTFIKLAMVGAIGMLALGNIANAQAPFDGKKFFEELNDRGGKFPANFDGKKFFDDIADQAGKSKAPFDAQKFFEELNNRGAKFPADFDGNKFFEDISSRGGGLPVGVVLKKK